MDWQNFAAFMGAWTVASLPFGILVGKFFAYGEVVDRANQEADLRRSALLIGPPALVALPMMAARANRVAIKSSRTA